MYIVGIVRGMFSKVCIWEYLKSFYFFLIEIFERVCEYMFCWIGLRCYKKLLVYDNGKWNVWFFL